MARPEDAFRAQPVVMAAIAAHGLDVDRLPWEPCDQAVGEEVALDARDAAPSLRLHSGGSASLRWWRGRGDAVAFTLEDDGYAIVTLEERLTPDAVLVAMAGRRLSEVVDLPGAGGMVIVEAVNSRAFASDPDDTRISVTPAGVAPVDPQPCGGLR